MSAINAKASRKMKKYAVLTREPRCFLGSLAFSWEQRKTIDIASDHGDKDDAFDIIVLVDGNVCVTMLLHDIEA